MLVTCLNGAQLLPRLQEGFQEVVKDPWEDHVLLDWRDRYM